MINGGLINGFPINSSSGDYTEYDSIVFIYQSIVPLEYDVTLPIEIAVVGTDYDSFFGISQAIYQEYSSLLDIEQSIVGYTDYESFLYIAQSIYGDYSTSLTVQQIVYDLAALSLGSEWSASVSVDGIDVTENLTGSIDIDMEEESSAIATVVIEPATGVINPKDWVNSCVVVFYNSKENGVITSTIPIFNGVVDIPEYAITENLLSLSCTDNLQRIFEGRSRQEIAAVTGGWWSKYVFNEDADSWDYAQDRMSTIPASLDLDINRQPVKTLWQAKTVPDFTYTEDTIDDGILRVGVAGARDLINKVLLKVEYRYERLLQRSIDYDFYLDINDLLLGATGPGPEQIVQAMNGTGWSIVDPPVFLGIHEPGNYPNPLPGTTGQVAFLSDCPRYSSVGKAAFTLSKRWTQTVTETWNVTILCQASIDAVGELLSENSIGMSLSDETLKRADTWTEEQSKVVRMSLFSAGPPPNPYCSTWVDSYDLVFSSYAQPVYPTMQSFAETGDKYYDLDDGEEDGRDEFNNTLQTVVNMYSTELLNSHRQGNALFTTELNPLITRSHTVQVTTGRVQVKGKVRRIRHTMDIDSGEATTEVTLAVSQAFGVGIVTPTPITPEDKPTVTQEPETLAESGGHIPLFTTDMPEDTQGWDYINSLFVIKTPGVDKANVDHSTPQKTKKYLVNVPTDVLVMEAP